MWQRTFGWSAHRNANKTLSDSSQ